MDAQGSVKMPRHGRQVTHAMRQLIERLSAKLLAIPLVPRVGV